MELRSWKRTVGFGFLIFEFGWSCRIKIFFFFLVCFLFGNSGAILHLSSLHFIFIETISFWGLFGKKKHVSKMTWQLTAETNREGRGWFANRTKRWGVKSNHPQTLGVYFAIYHIYTSIIARAIKHFFILSLI